MSRANHPTVIEAERYVEFVGSLFDKVYFHFVEASRGCPEPEQATAHLQCASLAVRCGARADALADCRWHEAFHNAPRSQQ